MSGLHHRVPDYYIIGVMKGGTTVLNEFMCHHPDIISARQKEIHYFSLYPERSDDWYLDHFDFQDDKLIGDASPTYFHLAYSNAIPKQIKQFSPDAKILLIVRDPIDRAVSQFFHTRHINDIEVLKSMDVNSFFNRSYEQCSLELSAEDYYLNQCLQFSMYYRKALNFGSVFPKENLLVLQNDDLLTQPQETMDRVFKFMGLDSFESEAFDEVKYSRGDTQQALRFTNKLTQLFKRKDKEKLDNATINKIAKYLYPNYELFCQAAEIPFKAKY